MSRRAEVQKEMEGLFGEWQQSGRPPGRAFARLKGISAAKFYYWKRRLESGRGNGGGRSASKAPRFVPVRVVGAAEEEFESVLEVVLETGERVRLTEGVTEELLRRTLGVLRERC